MLAVSLFSVLAVTACSGKNDSTGTKGSDNASISQKESVSSTAPNQQHTLKYQYVGENTEYASYGFAYTYYLNLYEDGTLDGYGYKFYSLDTTAAAENQNFSKWFEGKWGKAKDDDGEDCLKLVVSYVSGLTSMAGQAISGKFNYYTYENGTGLDAINDFSVPLGMSGRNVRLEYNTKTFYKTSDEFIKGTVYHFEEPTTYAALFTDTKNSDRIYLFADNTGYYYGASKNPADDNAIGYYPKQEVSWSYQSNVLKVNIGGDKEVTIEGKKGTLAWEETLQGSYKNEHSFVCEDVSSLTAADSGETKQDSYPQGTLYFTYEYYPSYHLSATFYSPVAEWMAGIGGDATKAYVPVSGNEENLFAFHNKDENSKATFTLLKNGTFKFHNSFGADKNFDFTGTFAYEGHYKFTFTTDANEAATIAVVETSIAR